MDFQTMNFLILIIAILAFNQSALASDSIHFEIGRFQSTRNGHPLPISPLAGGKEAQVGQFPWIVVIHQLLGDGISMCSGSILSVRWVLTAGHCIVDSPRKFLVVFGDNDKNHIRYDRYRGPGISMITTKGIVHEQYRQTVNDIGLLYMPEDIPFKRTIQPIKLDSGNPYDQSFTGKKAVILGWGKQEYEDSSRFLKFGRIPIMSNNECGKYWSVDHRNLCTVARTDNDACQGDSGGPLVLHANNQYLQIGIVSYGDSDCPSERPGVFTRVSAYTRWIKQVTGIQY